MSASDRGAYTTHQQKLEVAATRVAESRAATEERRVGAIVNAIRRHDPRLWDDAPGLAVAVLAAKERCATCGLELPVSVADAMDQPLPEALCYRNHARHSGCLFAVTIDQARGPWVLEVFKPLPPEEAEALREYWP